MLDKTLYFFLLAILGIGAIALLLVSWLTPMPVIERVIMTFFAAIGVTMAWTVHRFLIFSSRGKGKKA